MNASSRTIRLATRGSKLALRQAELVGAALEDRRYSVELVEVETRGDQLQDELIRRLGRTGAFVRALDEEVLAGDLDAAVHSMKDMPTEMPDDLVVAGVPARAAAGDVLVTPDGTTLEELPDGATVGTSSLRRGAQLLSARADLSIEPLRGNVDTRIEKLLAPHRQRAYDRRQAAESGDGSEDTGNSTGDRTAQQWYAELTDIERRALERDAEVEYDAIVLAEAGLERAGLLDRVASERLPPSTFVPAPGQGALAVTAHDDETGALIHDIVDHPKTRVETTVERTILATLGGGCVAPLGAYAVLRGDQVHCSVRVLSTDGRDEIAGQRDLPVQRHAEAAREFARDLGDRGADTLIEAARDGADTDAPLRGDDGSPDA